jgi:hypothetical protein
MTTTKSAEGAYNTHLNDGFREMLEATLRSGNPEDTARLLEKAKALIEDPKHWLKGKYQDERDGVQCFCLDGALMVADEPQVRDPLSDEYWAANAALMLTIGGNIVGFNDDEATTHADVLKALDTAIEKVQA